MPLTPDQLTTLKSKIKQYRCALDAPMEPLTPNATSSLTLALLSEMNNSPCCQETLISPLFLAALRRVKDWSDITLSPWLIAFLCSLDPRPANAVLWGWMIVQKARTSGKLETSHEITLNDWCTWWPWGIPTELELNKAWDNQKICIPDHPDNLLDYKEAWEIIL